MLFGQPVRSRPTVLHAASGWFLAPVSRSVERHQTALRGPADLPSGGPAVAQEARHLRNLSVPTGRSFKTHGSIPRRGDGPAGDPRGNRGGRHPRRSWFQLQTASAQLDNDSPVGPHLSPAPHSAARELLQVDLVPCQSRSPVRGPIQTQRGRACAAARPERSNLKSPSCERGRLGCPSSANSSPDRAGVSRPPSRTVHGSVLFARGMGPSPRRPPQPRRKRFRSNGTSGVARVGAKRAVTRWGRPNCIHCSPKK